MIDAGDVQDVECFNNVFRRSFFAGVATTGRPRERISANTRANWDGGCPTSLESSPEAMEVIHEGLQFGQRVYRVLLGEMAQEVRDEPPVMPGSASPSCSACTIPSTKTGINTTCVIASAGRRRFRVLHHAVGLGALQIRRR